MAFAVASTFGQTRTTTFVDGAWAIANATSIVETNAVIYVITNAVFVRVFKAIPAAHANRIEERCS